MPSGIQRRPESVVRESLNEGDRTRLEDYRYSVETFDDDNLYVELGIKPAQGAEALIDNMTALADGLLDIADGRDVNIAVVTSGERMSRITIDSSHADLKGKMLRMRVIMGMRVT